MRRTRLSSRVIQPVQPFAAGLHHSEKRRTYLFQDFTRGSVPKRMLTIGRGRDCDIQLHGPFVSIVHAVLERRGDAMWLSDHVSTNGVYINDERIENAVALTVGMHITIGHEHLIATDAQAMFPIAATTISDLCRKAASLYGSDHLAGTRLGRSHTFIGWARVPRALRRKVSRGEWRRKNEPL